MPLILSGNVATALGTGYDVANSCRFNRGDSPALSYSFSSTATSWTVSCWLKRSELSTNTMYPFGFGTAGTDAAGISFSSSDSMAYYDEDGGTLVRDTSIVFRDPTAWFHLVAKNSSGTITTYINNVQQATGSGGEALDGSTFYVGRFAGSTAYHWDGYISEFYFIDGTAYSPSTFGEYDEDSPKIWKPIKASPTFGSDGFFLEFKESGTSANSSGIGADTSGNGNHLTVSNLAATDQSTDTCTNNFCVMNPLATGSNITLSEGGLVTTGNTSSDSGLSTTTIPFAFSGKWYWEVKMTDATSDYPYMGIFDDWESVFDADLNGAGGAALQMDVYIRGGNTTLYKPGTDLSITAPADGNIIMFAIDKDNNKFYIGINGTWYNSGDPTTGATGTGSLMDLTANTMTMFGIHEYNGSDSSVNFGSPAYANSSSVADANGYGDFEYTPPSGYLSLCTKNLGSSGG